MTMPGLTFPPRSARLGRYSAWQSRDFVINVAILTVVLFALIGGVEIMQLRFQERVMAGRQFQRPMSINVKLMQFLSIYGMFSIVAPIIATSGIVSQDRTLGYTRFLFSKPLSVRSFYLQSFLVRLIGLLALGQILVLAYGHFEPPAYTPRFLAEMSISFLSVAGVVFLLSTVTRYDGLLAIVFFLLGTLVRSRWESAGGLGQALTYLFPPIDQSEQLRRWVLGLGPMGELISPNFPWKVVLWNGGYGLACLVLGLYLLRRIPLTKA